MSYCRQCGAVLPEDANFCPTCGSRVLSETKPIERHHVLKTTGKPKVVVANTAPGSIRVKSGSEGEVTIDLDLKVPEDLDCNISQDSNIITVTCRAKVGFWG
ncbi:zinc ribbon domain-containing protein, partial [Candidatus Bathyarchaeota archaeon]|nr:zinc ribbon domain-containing protein [Candidatus Bathyarchaeota archaeon]